MLNEPEGKRLVAEFQAAKSIRSLYEPMWDEYMALAMPERPRFEAKTPGSRNNQSVFDETAVVGVKEFASRMISGIVPAYTNFAKLEPGIMIPPEAAPEFMAQLDPIVDYVFLMIRQSNFQEEIEEGFLDLSVGNSLLTCEDGGPTAPLVFRTHPMTQIYFRNGPFGNVDTVWIERDVRASHLKTVFPKADYSDEEIARDPKKNIKVVEMVQRDWAFPQDERYKYRVFLCDASARILVSDEYRGEGSCPMIPYRWSHFAGEDYGRGPGLDALPAIKSANLTMQLIFENAEMSIAGMWETEDEGMVNADNVYLEPGALLYRQPGTQGLRALQAGGNFDVSQIILNEMRHNIRKALFNETLGPRQGTPPTATEIQERMNDLSRQIGSAFGRLQAELVQPLIRRVIYLLKKQGRIEMPSLDGSYVRMTPVSPLARTQQNERISQLRLWAQDVASIFGPQVIPTLLKDSETSEYLAINREIPTNLILTKAERQALATQSGQLAGQGGAPAEILASLAQAAVKG